MAYVKKIGQIALPLLGEQFLQVSMGSVDSYLIAYLGVVALSGVSVANTIIVVYQAIFLALGTAVSSFVSSDSESQEDNVLSEIISLTIFIGLFLALFSLLLSSSFLLWLGTSLEVAEVGGGYLALVGGGAIFLGLMISLGAYLRAKGHYRYPVRVSLLANLLNLVLSALSVYVFQWGLLGVAGATVFSRLVAVIILYKKLDISINRLKWQLHFSSDLCHLAFPVTLERLFMRAGDVVTISLMAAFGTEVLAGNAIGETLTQFNYMSGFAISTAIVILSAQMRANRQRLQSFLRSSYFLMLLVMGMTGLLIVACRAYLIGLFHPQAEVFEVASLVTVFSLLGLPVTAGTLSLTALYQGLGNSKLPFYATAMGMWGIRIIFGYLLAFSMELGLVGLYLATMLDNAFRATFLYLSWRREKGLV